MPGKSDKHYTTKFKLRVVLKVLDSEKSEAEVARAFDVDPGTVSEWTQAFLAKEPGSKKGEQGDDRTGPKDVEHSHPVPIGSLGLSPSGNRPTVVIRSSALSSDKRRFLRELLREIGWRQHLFLRFGSEWILADNRTDLARALEVHPSTLGRHIRGVWVETPHGPLPIAVFVSPGVRMIRGNRALSQYSVAVSLLRIIASEDPENPFKDQDLTEQMRELGVDIARRTVAKYRQLLGLPTGSKRRRMHRGDSKLSTSQLRATFLRNQFSESADVRAAQKDKRADEKDDGDDPVPKASGPPDRPQIDTPEPNLGRQLRRNQLERSLKALLASLQDPAVEPQDLVRLLRARGLSASTREVAAILRSLSLESPGHRKG